MWYVLKIFISALLIVAVSEAAKRSSVLGAVIASVPLVSVLGMIWLYVETKDTAKIAALSRDILVLVLPSLPLFVILPSLLTRGVGFFTALAAGLAATIVCYLAAVYLLAKFGGD
jgi:hypothetical protein